MQQFLIAIKESPIVFKVCDHKTDDALVVIKTRHPELGSMIAQIAETSVSDTIKGGHYYITACNRAEFFAGLGKFMAEVALGNVQILPPAALQDVAPEVTPFVADLDAAVAMANGDEEDEEDDDEEEEE